MELNIKYFCQEKFPLFRLKRQNCEFIYAPSVVLFSPVATSKHFSIIECLGRNGSTIFSLREGKKFKSSKVKEIFSHSVGCLIHYLIICVFISIDFFFRLMERKKPAAFLTQEQLQQEPISFITWTMLFRNDENFKGLFPAANFASELN